MFYDNYVRLCAAVGKSPSAVALEIGLKKSNVTYWKNGRNKPSDVTVQKVADYFGVSVAELTGEWAQQKKPIPNEGDGPESLIKQELMDLIQDLSEEETALMIARAKKIKESRI